MVTRRRCRAAWSVTGTLVTLGLVAAGLAGQAPPPGRGYT